MLDGLVEDMIAHGPPEGKHQSPPPAINTAVLPQTQIEQPPTSTPTTASAGIASLPPTILALLGAVPTTPVAAQPAAVPVAVSPPAPPLQSFTLDPTQLALINQLAAQAVPAPVPPVQSPPPPPANHFSDPVRRPSGGGERPVGSGRAPLPGVGEEGKDEFGRDVRDGAGGGDSASTPVDVETKRSTPASVPDVELAPAIPPAVASTTQSQVQAGLAGLDMTAFDFTDPASWARLATAWEQTYGRSPTQEEMMAFISGGGVMGGMGNGAGAAGGTDQWDQSQSQAQSGWGGGGGGRGRGRGGWQPRGGGGGFRGRGRGRGRGGGGYNGGYNGGYDNGGGGEYGGFGGGGGDSDAVVLGGGGGDTNEGGYPAYAYSGQNENGNGHGYGYGGMNGDSGAVPAPAPTSSGGGGGGMKKVDGKWIWSKN
ncbi:hypothetical protein FRC07_009992 [Ceratobasidium sp. 392]|nr:hypothetical protein FRC07_009992 [Ceratobasidium sp. 392]